MWMASFSMMGFCQGFINYENVASTTLKDKDGNKYGTGDLQRISGRFSLPLYRSLNESNQPTAWGLTLSASYNKMNNEEEAQELNPDKVLNTTLTISHIRPLSERWSLMASLGAGIYAIPDEIRWQSILANGAVFFIYRLHGNLSIGLGGGLTNSYGAPHSLAHGLPKLEDKRTIQCHHRHRQCAKGTSDDTNRQCHRCLTPQSLSVRQVPDGEPAATILYGKGKNEIPV